VVAARGPRLRLAASWSGSRALLSTWPREARQGVIGAERREYSHAFLDQASSGSLLRVNPARRPPARIIRLGPEEAGNDLAGAGVKRTMRICGTLILSGLSADGAAQLALGLGLGADGATLVGIAAFFSNFMIALIAA
jgi:hypothetical protein